MNEREALTLEKWRELRGHVAGMQCAIDNCGINKEERNEAAKYAMDNIGEWKRLLSEYAAHLSRAAEPVGEVGELAGSAGGFTHAVFKAADVPVGTKLFTHPPEPARDACTWVEDSDYGTWDTKCGNRFVLNEGTPAENHMRHCCYCGHELEEIPYSEDAAMAQESGDE